jgi:hypothetical protein
MGGKIASLALLLVLEPFNGPPGARNSPARKAMLRRRTSAGASAHGDAPRPGVVPAEDFLQLHTTSQQAPPKLVENFQPMPHTHAAAPAGGMAMHAELGGPRNVPSEYNARKASPQPSSTADAILSRDASLHNGVLLAGAGHEQRTGAAAGVTGDGAEAAEAWNAESWRSEQEALFDAETATQSQQRRGIIGTEWSSNNIQRTADLNEALTALCNAESQLLKVLSCCVVTLLWLAAYHAWV